VKKEEIRNKKRGKCVLILSSLFFLIFNKTVDFLAPVITLLPTYFFI